MSAEDVETRERGTRAEPQTTVSPASDAERPWDEPGGESGSSDTETPTLRRPVLRCPSGHPLTPSTLSFCDVCGNLSGSHLGGGVSMACRACEYVVCVDCVAATAVPAGSATSAGDVA